ncbi:hypothetical protein C7M84_014474, partial [Penaeus vannamei]
AQERLGRRPGKSPSPPPRQRLLPSLPCAAARSSPSETPGPTRGALAMEGRPFCTVPVSRPLSRVSRRSFSSLLSTSYLAFVLGSFSAPFHRLFEGQAGSRRSRRLCSSSAILHSGRSVSCPVVGLIASVLASHRGICHLALPIYPTLLSSHLLRLSPLVSSLWSRYFFSRSFSSLFSPVFFQYFLISRLSSLSKEFLSFSPRPSLLVTAPSSLLLSSPGLSRVLPRSLLPFACDLLLPLPPASSASPLSSLSVFPLVVPIFLFCSHLSLLVSYFRLFFLISLNLSFSSFSSSSLISSSIYHHWCILSYRSRHWLGSFRFFSFSSLSIPSFSISRLLSSSVTSSWLLPPFRALLSPALSLSLSCILSSLTFLSLNSLSGLLSSFIRSLPRHPPSPLSSPSSSPWPKSVRLVSLFGLSLSSLQSVSRRLSLLFVALVFLSYFPFLYGSNVRDVYSGDDSCRWSRIRIVRAPAD